MKTLLATLISLIFTIPACCQGQVHIACSGLFLKDNDTAIVTVYKFNVLSANRHLLRNKVLTVKNKSFDVKIDSIFQVSTIDIFYKNNYGSTSLTYLVSPGDDIKIMLNADDISVAGKKASFVSLQAEFQKIESSLKTHFKTSQLKRNSIQYDSMANAQLQLLKSCKKNISDTEYEILENEVRETPRYRMFDEFIYLLRPGYKDEEAKNIYVKYITNLPAYDDRKFVSMLGLNYLFNRYKIDSCYLIGKAFEIKKYLNYIKLNFTGEVRNRLVVNSLRYADYAGDIAPELKYFSADCKNTEIRNFIDQFRNYSIDGVKAYDFKLRSMNDKIVKLSDFKGRPIVIDFWFTGCGACRITAPIIKKIEEQFVGTKVVFLSVSIDKNLDTWRKSVESGVYTSPEIINLNAGVTKEGEVAINKFQISGYPTIIVVDKLGRINRLKYNPQVDSGKSLSDQIQQVL